MKAIGLLSGGLDSALAVKLMLDQGIGVTAVKFTSPFCLCDQKGICYAARIAEDLDIPFKTISKGEEYLEVIRNPKHGYGSGMNPCIDCRIFMLKKTKQYMEKINAKFVFTGEVLGERPMSQHRRALQTIEREAGLEGKILRPLSAKLLPETIPEKKGWVNREELLSIKGRSRKPQLELADKLQIQEFACPSGGCLLTYKEFAAKVEDLFQSQEEISMKDVLFLKTGRHFRRGRNKIIVGRNEAENKHLLRLKNRSDYFFEVPGYGSPITILQGPKTENAIRAAARLTARYSDSPEGRVRVKYGKNQLADSLRVRPFSQERVNQLRV